MTRSKYVSVVSPMNHPKKINTLTSHLIEQLITERAPIHTYRKAIRTAKPYISFIYIDTDTLPTITNIPLNRPDLYTFFIDDSTRQNELHVLYRGDSRHSSDGKAPNIQSLTLDAQAGSVEMTIPIGEQHVFLDVPLIPKYQREKPVVQSLTLDAQAGSVEVTIPIKKQHVSLGVAIDPMDQREIPVVQFLTLDNQATAVELTIPIGEQHVSLDAQFNPKDLREIPVVQSLSLNAQAGTVAKTISCTTLRPSLDVSFNPYDQREKLFVHSLKQDVRTGSEEKTISIIQLKASLDVVFDLYKKHEEISTIPHILDNKAAQYINTTIREEQQYDSYNHLLAIVEPCRYDYRVSNTSTRSRIVRYHRYSRANHIVSSQDKA